MSRLANFRIPDDLDSSMRDTATKLGVDYSAFIRACLRYGIGSLDTRDVEILDDPELRKAKAQREAQQLLKDF